MGFTLDANTAWLDEVTPILVAGARELANDIDPIDPVLQAAVAEIGTQLTSQLELEADEVVVTGNRAAREADELLSGEASFRALQEELAVHRERVRNALDGVRLAKGPNAWRLRRRKQYLAGLDGLALINAVRRVQRIAGRIATRMPNGHIEKALRHFDSCAGNVIHLRNLSEHLDEYVLGKGRLDPIGREPGEVFELHVGPEDVTLTARGKSVAVLAADSHCQILLRCLEAAAEARYFDLIFP